MSDIKLNTTRFEIPKRDGLKFDPKMEIVVIDTNYINSEHDLDLEVAFAEQLALEINFAGFTVRDIKVISMIDYEANNPGWSRRIATVALFKV